MQYKKKRDNKKPLAVALGVILVLAPGAVIIDNLEPVPVYADAGELAGLTDFLDAGMAVDSSGVPSAAWNLNGYAAYTSGLWAIRECLKHPIEGTTWTLSSCASVSGKYYLYNQLYPCISVCVSGGKYAPDEGSFNLFQSPKFSITYQVFHNDQSYRDFDLSFSIYSSSGSTYVTTRAKNAPNESGTIGSFRGAVAFRCSGGVFDDYVLNYTTGSTVTVSRNLKYSSNIPVLDPSQGLSYYLQAGTNSHAIAGDWVRGTFPGSADTPITLDYIQDVYNPWYVEQYPELEPYIYAPYSPEFPDPSDAYPGIPKEWTIKNPQLPTSPSIGLNAYKPDLSEMNPSESIMEYDSGFDFWWWLTNQALTHTNTKTIVLLAILLGLVGYLLWHLGGHL